MLISKVLVLALLLNAHPNLPEIQFEINPTTVKSGESTQLKWHVKNAASVFIFSLGVVDSVGERQITPSEPSRLVLIAEGPGGINADTVVIKVEGGKEVPEYNQGLAFQEQLVGKINAPSLPQLLDYFQTVLQDSMNFTCQLYIPADGVWIFETKRARQDYLVASDERKIGGRRLAYRVQIAQSSTIKNGYSYLIKTLVDYQYKLSVRWYPELKEIYHKQAARRLRNYIEKGSVLFSGKR